MHCSWFFEDPWQGGTPLFYSSSKSLLSNLLMYNFTEAYSNFFHRSKICIGSISKECFKLNDTHTSQGCLNLNHVLFIMELAQVSSDFSWKKCWNELYEDWILFLTRKLRACARASYRYDVGNGIRSLARSIGRFL